MAEPVSAEWRTLLSANNNSGDARGRGASQNSGQAGKQGRAAYVPRRRRNRYGQTYTGPTYGALDLGTNNCRLLVAVPQGPGRFRVVDAFSRIVRLGEKLGETGTLSDGAMERTMAALQVCADKLKRRSVEHVRCIATQACRSAANGEAFLAEAKATTGLSLEIITPREEARLAVMGCLALVDREVDAALVVDIGGGSTELSWIDVKELRAREARGLKMSPPIVGWASIPLGVVTVSELFPEPELGREAWYAAMKAHVAERLPVPDGAARLRGAFDAGAAHLVGTSGTITSLAGVHLELDHYDRSKVDGVWLSTPEANAAARRLESKVQAERALEPCIGPDRADLVLAGCAIFEAIMEAWPTPRLRVADRGLREGVLMSLMHPPKRRRRRGGRNRRGGRSGGQGGGEGGGAQVGAGGGEQSVGPTGGSAPDGDNS